MGRRGPCCCAAACVVAAGVAAVAALPPGRWIWHGAFVASGAVRRGGALRCSGRLCAGLPARRLGSRAGLLSGRAGRDGREAHIAVVDVQVNEGDEAAFLAASLDNARESFKEEGNMRFDVLESRDKSSNFVLVEMYDRADGPVAHKATEHYNKWRDTVADMMAEPRSATQWDTVWPSAARSFEPGVLIVERQDPYYLDIIHQYFQLIRGADVMFLAKTVECAKTAVASEVECLRFDVLKSVDDPTKFLLNQVWRSSAGAQAHKRTGHYIRWRRDVTSYLAEDQVIKKYTNQFPNVPAGWTVDEQAN